MLKSIEVSSLETWKANYAAPKNKALDMLTESAVISLELLQRFIDEAKENSPGFNGVRVYFVRYDKPNDNLRANNEYPAGDEKYKYVGEIGNSGLSQASLAFVPVKNFDPVTLSGSDFVQQMDNKIHTLAICHPSDWQIGTMGNGTMQADKIQPRGYAMQMELPADTPYAETIDIKTMETGTGLCPPKCPHT